MLLDNPAGWSRSAVGTWPRFIFMASFFAAWPFAIAYVAIEGGWRPAIACALFLGWFQVMLLYALRRAIGGNPSPNNSHVA